MCEIYKNLSLEDMRGEIWKDIPNYEGYYQVSNMGRVKSLNRVIVMKNGVSRKTKGLILKQKYEERTGYLIATLYKKHKRKDVLVHRLVAQTFIVNSENKRQVNHINEDKTDNRVENLEWMTAKENSNHGTRNERIKNTQIKNGYIKKMSQPILQYDLEGNLIKEWESAREAGRNGFDRSSIAKCCKGKQKIHKGFVWEYKSENKSID